MAVWRTPQFFLHYLDRPVLDLYSPRITAPALLEPVTQMTKYALLASEEPLVMPVAYLFEAPLVERLIQMLDKQRAGPLIVFSSPTQDLDVYGRKKRDREHRDHPVLSQQYELLPGLGLHQGLDSIVWLPRYRHSASRDVSSAWRTQFDREGIAFQEVIEGALDRKGLSVSAIEDALVSVPERLEGRAFLYEYVRTLIPITLHPRDETRFKMLMSAAYLLSYLREHEAVLWRDTPLGKLDCNIASTDEDGSLRTLSYHGLLRSLAAAGLSECLDVLTWSEVIRLRNDSIFRWLITSILDGSFSNNHTMGFPVLEPRRLNIVIRIRDHILRIHDAMTANSSGALRRLPPGRSRSTGSRTPSLFSGARHVPNVERTRCVFLVHGRDVASNESMRSYLRALDLVPVEWEDAVKYTGTASPFTLDVIRAGLDMAQAALVLLTPDEDVQLVARLATSDIDRVAAKQARPNVIFEAGMALALQPERTLLVPVGDVRLLTDIDGINYVRMDGSPESRHRLLKRLETAGCVCNPSSDYLRVGFGHLAPPP